MSILSNSKVLKSKWIFPIQTSLGSKDFSLKGRDRFKLGLNFDQLDDLLHGYLIDDIHIAIPVGVIQDKDREIKIK